MYVGMEDQKIIWNGKRKKNYACSVFLLIKATEDYGLGLASLGLTEVR